MSRSPRARTDDDAPPTDWLAELPHELLLHILEGVDDFSDCAAFSLASPRLGRLALRSDLPRFKDPLFAVAMRLQLAQRVAAPRRSPRLAAAIPPSPLTESILRKYAADRRASADYFPWLARVSPALCLSTELGGPGDNRIDIWRLKRGEESGAALRLRSLRYGSVVHCEGEQGAERLVRAECPDGTVEHFEGERDVERMVRKVRADGAVVHFEGERGAERKVRTDMPDAVVHFEGERGAERQVRMVLADGVGHYEGEQGAERLVCHEFADGSVSYYEGEQGAPRLVRVVNAGNVGHYEGERGAERLVRSEFAVGVVGHYEGEQGSERMVRVVHADGSV